MWVHTHSWTREGRVGGQYLTPLKFGAEVRNFIRRLRHWVKINPSIMLRDKT